MHFADKLKKAVEEKGNFVCVGLDPRLKQIPKFITQKHQKNEKLSFMKAIAESILEFNKGIIDAVADLVPVIKPQVSFYELYGAEGMWAFKETLKYGKAKGLITIADIKRGDIGSTAEAYAKAYLGEVDIFEGENEVVMPMFDADAVTVNPYMGWDAVKPFVEEAKKYDKGVFVLLKTSNKSSVDLQDLTTSDNVPVFEIMAHYIESWGEDYRSKESGLSLLGAVVGATHFEEAKKIRHLMPNTIFLVPGYGAQGGGAEDVKPTLMEDGFGAIVNSSRAINFAYQKNEKYSDVDYAKAAREATKAMIEDLNSLKSSE